MSGADAGTAARRFAEERREQVVTLLREMIAIPSVTGAEGPFARFCAGWLEDHGIEAHLQPVKDRANVAGVVGRGPAALVLSGHLDTVPADEPAWSRSPWDPVVRDGRVHGLGASDLKASIAAAYVASLHLATLDLPGRVITAMTIEEETTGDGTIAFLDRALADGFLEPARTACIVTEPTGLDHVSLGSRGALWVVVHVRGLGGHGSRPHLARNPIDACRRILAGLPERVRDWNERFPDPDFPETSVTPTAVTAGDLSRTNVIPERAALVLDCRPVPALAADDFAALRRELPPFLRDCAGAGFTVTLEERYPRPGHKLDRDHPLARTTLAVLREELGRPHADFRYTPAGNDACHFAARGIPTINKVGPGHPECAHRVDEHVAIENVVRGVEFFIRVALRHFGRTSDGGEAAR